MKLMLEKREQERSAKEAQDTSRLRWEQERQKEAARRNSVENQRRQSLQEQSQLREARRVGVNRQMLYTTHFSTLCTICFYRNQKVLSHS